MLSINSVTPPIIIYIATIMLAATTDVIGIEKNKIAETIFNIPFTITQAKFPTPK